jgi:hypothetical protein
MLSGTFNWAAGPIGVMLVSSAYTPNFTTDVTVADIPSLGQICAPQALSSLTAVNGVAGAGNILLTSVSKAQVMTALVIVELNTGTASASKLIAYIDTATGLGVFPGQNSIQIVWDVAGIFEP